MLVGGCKQKATDQAEDYENPVAKDDMGEAERKSTGKEHGPSRTEERLVTMKEEGPIEELLRIDRKQRVQQHDDRAEHWRALHQREGKGRGEEPGGNDQKHEENRIANEQRHQERPNIPPGQQAGLVKRRVVPQDQERAQPGQQ